MQDFIRKNPVRVAAFISSAVTLLLTIVNPDLPAEQAVILILSLLGLGEYAQRVENDKTIEALLVDPSELEDYEDEL